MDVDQPVMPGSDEAFGQQAHEAGKHDELGAGFADGAVERRIEARPVGKALVIDHRGGQARPGGAIDSLHARTVGDNEHDLDRTVGDGGTEAIDQRLQVAAPTRDQHGDFELAAYHRPVSRTRQPGSPARRVSIVPIAATRSPALLRTSETAAA